MNESKIVLFAIFIFIYQGKVIGAEFVRGIGSNSKGDFGHTFKSGSTCVLGALGAAAAKINALSQSHERAATTSFIYSEYRHKKGVIMVYCFCCAFLYN